MVLLPAPAYRKSSHSSKPTIGRGLSPWAWNITLIGVGSHAEIPFCRPLVCLASHRRRVYREGSCFGFRDSQRGISPDRSTCDPRFPSGYSLFRRISVPDRGI